MICNLLQVSPYLRRLVWAEPLGIQKNFFGPTKVVGLFETPKPFLCLEVYNNILIKPEFMHGHQLRAHMKFDHSGSIW